MELNNIIVSICCLAYNHEPYIRECLEGFLMQKTTFGFEVLIHDDASKDNTAKIVREYEQKYPEIIKPIYQTENQYSKGVGVTRVFNFPRAKGKYIAMCEGDDYWTDPYKLQKQIDFLEKNPEFSFVFHNAEILQRNNTKSLFCLDNDEVNFSTEDFFNGSLRIPTHSIVFRKEFLETPPWFSYIQQGDLGMELMLSLNGPIHYINEVMGVYRKHATSLGATTSAVKTDLRKFELLSYFDMHTDFKYHSIILEFKKGLTKNLFFQFLIETGRLRKYLNLDFYLFKYSKFLPKLKG